MIKEIRYSEAAKSGDVEYIFRLLKEAYRTGAIPVSASPTGYVLPLSVRKIIDGGTTTFTIAYPKINPHGVTVYNVIEETQDGKVFKYSMKAKTSYYHDVRTNSGERVD